MFRRFNTLAHRLTYGEPLILVPLLLVIGGVWAFVEVADEVHEGDTRKIDEWAIMALRRPGEAEHPIGPEWLHEAARDVTALGGVSVIVTMVAVVAGFLVLRRKFHMLWLLLTAVGGGIIISQSLKGFFSRPRPELVPHLAQVFTSSFPSGHSMMSAVVYGTLGTLLARVAVGWRERVYILAVALIVSALVGFSRVYLGVHYPSDVLAGWTAGIAWALLCWTVATWLQRRGAVEKPGEEAART
jgi:undecaprenyl-diphosphatase